ncbi:MAG: hypothetical protein ABH846_04810, partial [Patescibacteria group bacterium]
MGHNFFSIRDNIKGFTEKCQLLVKYLTFTVFFDILSCPFGLLLLHLFQPFPLRRYFMYVSCADNGHGRCANEYHNTMPLRDDCRCKYGRAWSSDPLTQVCPVCDEQLVPKHLGCVVHPEFLQALKAGGAQKPRIKANDFGLISGLFKN